MHGLGNNGVANMADGEVVMKLVEFWLVEDFRDEAHAGDGLEDVVVDGDNFGTFLAAVLEGKVVEA